MELLLSSTVLFSLVQNKFPSILPFHVTTHFQHFHVLRSRQSVYQDFQEYAKPSRLLPASEVKIITDIFDEEEVTSFMFSGTESMYKVKLQTSNIYGSDLTDLNSGVLLCLIDENGSSILQRLPAMGNSAGLADDAMADMLHFQRGTVDEFFFKGLALGKIIALWIGLESGQWRIGGVSLTVVCHSQPSPSEIYQINQQYTSFQYNFEVEDIMLGDESDISMIELRPHLVTAIADDYFASFFEKASQPSSSPNGYLLSNEESMKEYAYLKFSLLFYDAVLVLTGSSIASIMTMDNTSFAFLTGGTCGFLYLLLLQKSVDGLPVQELVPGKENVTFGRALERFKGPVSNLVWLFAFAAITVKYASARGAMQLNPKDITVGMIGFLMCKVSIVLAAFKPLPFGARENK